MCTLTLSTFKKGCMDIGGIEKLWVVDKSTLPADLVLAVANGAVTITPGATNASAYVIDPVQNSFAVTNPTNAAPESNSLFYEQTITGILHENDAATTALVENINKGRTLWLVKSRNGVYRMFGTDVNGMQANGGDGFTSGQANGDPQGVNVSLISQSTYVAPVLEDFATFEDAFDIVEPVS